MNGMILEEKTRNSQELFELIGEFMMNGNKISKEICESKCEIMYKLM